MPAWQATCVAIGTRALMIEGPPGAGKSSLALALIDRGALLVGDDSLMLKPREGRLIATPHDSTRGLLEVRNLGLLEFPVCPEAPVALVLALDEDAPRYIEESETVERFGIRLPLIRLWPRSPALPLRAELALKRFGMG